MVIGASRINANTGKQVGEIDHNKHATTACNFRSTLISRDKRIRHTTIYRNNVKREYREVDIYFFSRVNVSRDNTWKKEDE